MSFENTLEFARQQDGSDELAAFRKRFLFPQYEGKEVVYLTGNSLGLQPNGAKAALIQELDDWNEFGVEGHFKAKHPWFSYHEMFKEPLAEIVGAKPEEVTAMNGLTANLHFLMVSFYRPDPERFKILCEAKAFPSDQYVLESQARFHGFNPEEAILEISPREGEHLIRDADILKAIEQDGNEIAMILIGGVNYYTGQLFDMKTITEVAQKKNIVVGFDLAHAAGNVPLKLHEWEVDFAAWCSYKYLNSGPGSSGGIFVHERHGKNKNLPRFAGWWGNDPESRFQMKKGFEPDVGADGWQLSNAPVFSMAVHRESLDLFTEAGMERLFEKSRKLTGYLEFIIDNISSQFNDVDLEIITPREQHRRGAQLSILTGGIGKELFNHLTASGVVVDWREPNVIRMAPVPMYNSFEDLYQFGQGLKTGIETLK